MKIRESAVAGQFYSGGKEELLSEVKELFSGVKGKGKAEAVIVPHAGYTYSGKIAALGFSALKRSGTYVILSPNHSGLGAAVSISNSDYWETPLGKVKVNKELAERIAAKIGELDELAHIGEHSIEVQLPLMQFLFGEEFEIVAITLGEHSLGELKKLGKVLAELSAVEDFVVVASSDFTHFESEESAKEKDLKGIGFIKALDVEGFHSFVEGEKVSICGYCAITMLMEYCKEKGFSEVELLRYGSSAEASGDTGNVVGYAAIKFEK